MAELKLEEMLKIMRNENSYSEDCYKKAVNKGWYTDDAPGKAQYFSDVNTVALPPAPVAAPALGTTATATKQPANYGEMHLYQKQMLLADLEMPNYQSRQSLNQEQQKKEKSLNENKQISKYWRNFAIATGAAGILAIFGQSKIPSVSIDESVAQYEVQRQEVDVQDYMRTHEGRSPPWQKSPEKIRTDTATNYAPIKSLLLLGGILSLIGSAASGIYSFFTRK